MCGKKEDTDKICTCVPPCVSYWILNITVYSLIGADAPGVGWMFAHEQHWECTEQMNVFPVNLLGVGGFNSSSGREKLKLSAALNMTHNNDQTKKSQHVWLF